MQTVILTDGTDLDDFIHIYADGFERHVADGPGWKDRVRAEVAALGLRAGTEVKLTRFRNHVSTGERHTVTVR